MSTTYSNGVITVGAGSTIVTGTGTMWDTSGVQAGDVFNATGLNVIISSVDSATQLTLKRAWPGGALASADYDIEFVFDDQRALTASNKLLQSLGGSGTLTSLAGLSSAANKLAYFTGAGIMALMDFPTTVRDLLSNSMLTKSGDNIVTKAGSRIIGEAVTQSSQDKTASRLLKVGDFGLGTAITLANEAELDSVEASGFYVVDGVLAATHFELSSSFRIQNKVDLSDGDLKTYVRSNTGSGWTDWMSDAGLRSISGSIADTAVDVFIYDTSRDRDGGAWRARCQHLSWYQETLGTATRGTRREFPAVAVIVAEANKVTIYDGDDPALSMWMVFNATGGSILRSGSITSVGMREGVLCVGHLSGGGVHIIDMLADSGRWLSASTSYGGPFLKSGISQRNDGGSNYFSNVSGASQVSIVNSNINAVSITALPCAPLNEKTGMPYPTIYVFTEGGVSQIGWDGEVEVDAAWDQTHTVSTNNEALDGCAIEGGGFWWTSRNVSESGTYLLIEDNPLTADKSTAPDSAISPSAFASGTDIRYLAPGAPYIKHMAPGAVGNNQGLSRLFHNYTDADKGLVAYITSNYATGWMYGAPKGVWLSDTNVSSNGENDRCPAGNDLTVNGTVTKNVVATDAELVGFEGFSTTNFYSLAYDADFDFGTGDFHVMGWQKGAGYMLDRTDTSETGSRFAALTLSNLPRILVNNGSTTVALDANERIDDGWFFFCGGRKNGKLFVQVNGIYREGVSNAYNLDNGSGEVRVGVRIDETSPATALALVRCGPDAPTKEQLAKIYQDEKAMFQPDAGVTLYGTSDEVTALAQDPVTKELHAGTSQGRSTFQGLRRTSNTTNAVTTAIDAVNGLTMEQ